MNTKRTRPLSLLAPVALSFAALTVPVPGEGFEVIELPPRIPPVVSLAFIRGDVDQNTVVEPPDFFLLIDHVVDGDPIPCYDAADVNDDNYIDMQDIFYLYYFLFMGPRPPKPFPDCDRDPTPDAFGCAYPNCP